jgi:hypothetical protein
MAFKDQCMWGLVVFSIGKHFMAIAHLLWSIHQCLHAVAAPPPKKCHGFLEMEKGQNLMLQFIISGRLIVSTVNFSYHFQISVKQNLQTVTFSWFLFFLQIMMRMRGQC